MAFNDEFLFHIFLWLPAKSLYRFKSACKSFFEFPSETFFALKQSQNHQLKNDSGFFIQHNYCQRFNAYAELHPLPSEEFSFGVPRKSLQFLMDNVRILASSNGLLLCRDTTNRKPEEFLFICNPVTQSWLSIPSPEGITGEQDVNIVFECNSDDYMLIVINRPPDWLPYFECKVYSPNEGIWKKKKNIYTGPRDIHFEMPVFQNGAVHFISDCYPSIIKRSSFYRPYIIAYDINDGSSRILRLPNDARRGSDDLSCKMGIYKWGNVTSSFRSICLIRLRKSKFTAWFLKDYDSTSWKKILNIRVRAMGLMEQNPVVAGFTVMNGDTLVFATEKKVYRHPLTYEKYWKIEEVCSHECGTNVSFNSYSNTLRPCGNGAMPLPNLESFPLNS